MKKVILYILFCFVCLCMNAQTFEAIESQFDVRGLAQHNDLIVYFGTGLTWVDKSGKIIDSQVILEGLPSSEIKDVISDGKNGLYVLTIAGLGYVNEKRESKTIFDRSDFPDEQFQTLFMNKEGVLFCAGHHEVIQVKTDHSFSSYFHSDESNYVKKMTIDDEGNLVLGSFREVYIVDKNKTVKKLEIAARGSIQSMHTTASGRVIIVDYRNIYELVSGEINLLIQGKDITNGLKIYDAIFNEVDDYWLYTNEGNIVRNDHGSYTNFVPPAGLKTGNLGEDIIQLDDGEIWMSLRGQIVLRYDGTTWYKNDIKQEQKSIAVFAVKYLNNNTTIARQNPPTPLLYKDGKFTPLVSTPYEKLYVMAENKDGILHWSTNEGLHQYHNNEVSLVEKIPEISSFNFLEDELIYGLGDQVFIMKDGQKREVKENNHYLGWKDIGTLVISKTWTNELFVYSSRRNRQISVYDGSAWRKIITIEGKKIQQIKKILTTKSNTYIITQTGSVARYNASGLKWLRYHTETDDKTYDAFVAADGSLWLSTSRRVMSVLRGDEFITFDSPMDGNQHRLRGVIHEADNVYQLYIGSGRFKCTL